MFEFKNKDKVIDKVLNPLKITGKSIAEFEIGKLKGTGIYRFSKIIEVKVGERAYTRYLIFSKAEDTEYILEVFPSENGQNETYLYSLADTLPFSEDFLNVAGQLFFTTPEGDEYQRCVMPDHEDRIDGISGKVKVYDIESEKIEKQVGIKIWDYQRDVNGLAEYLNVEMMEDTGMFRIFTGEMIEEIFYKIYGEG